MDACWSKRVSQRLTEPPAELHGAHLGSSGRAFGVIRETIFGRKSVRRRPSCPGSDVLGLKSGANKLVFGKTKGFGEGGKGNHTGFSFESKPKTP